MPSHKKRIINDDWILSADMYAIEEGYLKDGNWYTTGAVKVLRVFHNKQTGEQRLFTKLAVDKFGSEEIIKLLPHPKPKKK